MGTNSQHLKKGRVGKTPMLILLGFATVILILAFAAAGARSQADLAKSAKKAEQRVDRLDRAYSQITALQKASFKDELLREDLSASFSDAAYKKEEDDLSFAEAYTAYTVFNETSKMPEPVQPEPEPQESEFEKKLKAQRENDFFKAMSASTQLNLNFDKRAFAQLTSANQGTVGAAPVQSPGVRVDYDAAIAQGQSDLEALRSRVQASGSASSAYQSGRYGSSDLSYYQSLVRTDGYTSPYTVEAAPAELLLRQGTVLPAILLTAINSDLPGQVKAQITEDVYDTHLGNHILIPKGTTLLGQYGASPGFGQERLMMGFNRLILPNGTSLNLGSQPGTSAEGLAGFDADVNNHMLRIIGNSIFLGGITASITMSQDTVYDSDGRRTAGSALSEALGTTLGMTLARIIERNMALSPTLEVDPGYVFNVTLTQDILFGKPYEDHYGR